ncbi:MAG: hypothetical protein A2202_04255 [Bdellovibrionales bacterium RIFOXYA1_FULL_36_14]|nr:MAG: hypothetical protein A2202_04255 [Bdellovibrionales bacterium RIFOXYA1_FULL_36_14]
MEYRGQNIQLKLLEAGLYNLQFNNGHSKVNVFDQVTLCELAETLTTIKSLKDIKGLIITSSKEVFIVGADIFEFMMHFNKSDDELKNWLREQNKVFNGFEDLNIPTVTAINGQSFGGGFEITLTSSYRVACESTQVGLLETNLGIIPGWGGTVRLSRLCGAKTAIEWITSGKKYSAINAQSVGAIDFITKKENLLEESVNLLKRLINGDLDWKTRQKVKTLPLVVSPEDLNWINDYKKIISNVHYPAFDLAVETILNGKDLPRDLALEIEGENFVNLAHSQTAKCLTQVFLSDQLVKKLSNKMLVENQGVDKVLIIGAGTMGTGIACNAQEKNIQVYLMDENLEVLKKQKKFVDEYCQKNAKNELKCIVKESINEPIDATFVVENIIENEIQKTKVFSQIEAKFPLETIIASNTSALSITQMSLTLKRPQNFCGIHFFNPVIKMPLVEVIKGAHTSEKTLSQAVTFANSLGKKIIVVNDCPGFLVNRLLFVYLQSFMHLLTESVAFDRIDKVMHEFGWPQGPASLLDSVGIDIVFRALSNVMTAYPDRLKHDFVTLYELLLTKQRLGVKTLKGFYTYTINNQGKKEKSIDDEIKILIKKQIRKSIQISDQEIVHRMMLPMIVEASLCLEEKIVSIPAEVDIGVIYGLGFPAFRGGLLGYADNLGMNKIISLLNNYKCLGEYFEPTKQLLTMQERKLLFY